jgi:hypothetical protein
MPTRIHVTTESLQLSAATWDAASTIVQQGSSNWYSASGAALNAANNFTQTNFLPLSGGTITGDLTITNNLSVQGSTTFIDTNVAVTSAMYIDTNSSETALRITQRGSGDVIRVEDDTHPDQTPFIVTSAGNVGIGTANPNRTLTVVGDVSAIGVSRFVKSNPVTDFSNIVEISRGNTFVIGFRDDGVVTANTFAVTQAGNSIMDSSGVGIQSTARFGFSSGTFAGTTDTDLRRDAADTLAQRRTTNPQEFRLYGTHTTGTPISSEYMYLRALSASSFVIGTSATGGLNARNFEIMKPEGAGASGAVGRRIVVTPGGAVGIGTVTGDQTSHGIWVNPAAGQTSITHGGQILVNTSSVMFNSNTRIFNNNAFTFGISQNNTTPMIRGTGVGTSTPGVQVRLSDDTNFAPLSAGGLAIDLTTSFPITGDASTGFITAISGHNFLSGDRVIFFELVGGSGLNGGFGGYFQPPPPTYFVRDLSGSRDFRISATLNGSPVSLTTNISAGSFISNLNPTVNLRAVDSANHSWLVLQPKGNGGIIAGPRPDGTTVGGNTRGRNAVDLQMVRSTAGQVTNGEYATTVGGAFNACNGRYSVVGGVSNTVTSDYNTAFGGNNLVNNSTGGTIFGGEFNNVSGNYSTVVGGTRGVARRQSSVVYANGRFSFDGDAQQGRLVFRNKSTTNTPVQLFLDGGSLRFTVPSSLTVSALIHVAATSSGGEHTCQFLRECVVRNRSGTTELRGSVATIGTDTMEVSGCSLSIQADDTNDALSILFTGYTPVTSLSALATTDQISGTNHGFQNNDDIVFTGLQSGAGITANTTTYWVTSAQPDTFYVSLTRGGTTPVNITTNYTAMTATRLMRVVGYADFVELGHGT